MFRTQQNAFDEAVAKATDENLTSENWEYILDVCDRANGEESGPKDVTAAMIKRLAHRNANVQLYTLELANALSQNCGINMHRELASRSFTDALLRLASDRNSHQQVKAKILERMAEWSTMFASNPDLGIMEQAYMRLKSQNPNLQPPSKPIKQQITDVDRQKEEEELQMALKLSIQDKQPAASSSRPAQSNQPSNDASTSANSTAAAPPQPISSGTTAATVSRVRALFDFQPSEPGELQFKKGDVIAVLESVYKDWWKGSLRGQVGIFPLNYVEKLTDPTPDELQREAQIEAEVFGEIKNVEKLLTLLSTSSSDLAVQDHDEITQLYHSTLAIRPKLIELIGKYSQRKDDFTQLNEKFIKARRDYEALLEASMAQPSMPYGRPPPSSYGYSNGYPPQGPPPAQSDPNRYYSPHSADGRNPQPPYPAQGGHQPYPPGGGQHLPQQAPSASPYPTPDPRHRTPSASAHAAGPPPGSMGGSVNGQETYDPRPQSTYELGATSSYPGPNAADQSQQFNSFPSQPHHNPSVPPADYPSGAYGSPEDAEPAPSHAPGQPYPQRTHPPPGQQLPYRTSSYSQGHGPTTAQQQGPAPPQPSYPAPQHPGAASPGPGGNLPDGTPTSAGAPPHQYQAYQPQRQSAYAGAAPSNPQDYYR